MLACAALAAFAAQPNCYGFPDRAFSPTNRVHICGPDDDGCGDSNVTLKTGQIAKDFTLSDRQGRAFSLYELLKDKPVFVEFGSFT